MNITNPRSNLTPQREDFKSVAKAKYGVLSKKIVLARDETGGYSEHSCHVLNTMPYLPASTAF